MMTLYTLKGPFILTLQTLSPPIHTLSRTICENKPILWLQIYTFIFLVSQFFVFYRPERTLALSSQYTIQSGSGRKISI